MKISEKQWLFLSLWLLLACATFWSYCRYTATPNREAKVEEKAEKLPAPVREDPVTTPFVRNDGITIVNDKGGRATFQNNSSNRPVVPPNPAFAK